MDWLRVWWVPLWAVVTTMFMLFASLLARTYAKKDDVQRLDSRIAKIESKLENLPTEKELHDLEVEIVSLKGEIKELRPLLNRLQHISDLLLENELKDR